MGNAVAGPPSLVRLVSAGTSSPPRPVGGNNGVSGRDLPTRSGLGEPGSAYRDGMRFVWAALAVLPFVVVLVGMVSGRVRARSCCAVPADQDARLHENPETLPAAPG